MNEKSKTKQWNWNNEEKWPNSVRTLNYTKKERAHKSWSAIMLRGIWTNQNGLWHKNMTYDPFGWRVNIERKERVKHICTNKIGGQAFVVFDYSARATERSLRALNTLCANICICAFIKKKKNSSCNHKRERAHFCNRQTIGWCICKLNHSFNNNNNKKVVQSGAHVYRTHRGNIVFFSISCMLFALLKQIHNLHRHTL